MWPTALSSKINITFMEISLPSFLPNTGIWTLFVSRKISFFPTTHTDLCKIKINSSALFFTLLHYMMWSPEAIDSFRIFLLFDIFLCFGRYSFIQVYKETLATSAILIRHRIGIVFSFLEMLHWWTTTCIIWACEREWQ